MNTFSSNPINIKDGDKNIGLIELRYDPDSIEYCLEVQNKEGKKLFEGIIDEDTTLSFDVKEKELTLIYKDYLTGNVFDRQTIDLFEYFSLYRKEKYADLIDDKNLLTQMIYQVKREMDSPKGSPKEIERHTEFLNKVNVNEEAKTYVLNKIKQIISRFDQITDKNIYHYANRIFAELYGMGILQPLDDNPKVGEIMVNARNYPEFQCDIYYLIDGKKYRYDKTFKNLDELTTVFTRSIASSKKDLNKLENAIIEETRSNGDRVNIIIPEASENYVLNIRKFGNFIPNEKMMREYGTVDDFIVKLMKVLVKGKANIGIGGEMGTGKTSFISYLLSYTDPIERKVVISTVTETDINRVLKGHDIIVLNVDDTRNFTFERQFRCALRTSAKRIIVPESRGIEIRQVYEANLKTKGNMFTAHALNDEDFLDICVDMYMGNGGIGDYRNLKYKFAKSLDIIIIMRTVGNFIRIKSISEVVKLKDQQSVILKPLYYWKQDLENPTKGQYVRTEYRLSEKLKKQLNENGVPMSEMELL